MVTQQQLVDYSTPTH